jgi:ABC transport system ATP-binding/permease protein
MTDITLARNEVPKSRSVTAGASPAPMGTAGGRINAVEVSQHAGQRQILHDVSLSIEPGELVAVVGSSGAGKTTLLEILAGLQRPSGGTVRHDGAVADARPTSGATIGYVPQDDIIHREMPLRRTLYYAARLRLPAGTSPERASQVVEETMHALDLAEWGDVAVGSLSGGQRKRASIAVELLTEPHFLFLDEPTSGLDPATSADVLRVLRQLTWRGVTVVLTTHDPATLPRCDRIVVLARDGYLAFTGTPEEARSYFGVDHLTDIYDVLGGDRPAHAWAERFRAWQSSTARSEPAAVPEPGMARSDRPGAPGAIRQWLLLTRRNAHVLVRNRLTLAVLLGSPALVTAMMAMLFRPGAFAAQNQGDLGPTQTVFWIAFAGFFFGLTYGLLQIVGEVAVFRRERVAGLSVGAYVASKVAVLLPVLACVAFVLLGVLRALDRLPAAGGDVYGMLFITILIEALSALALGLLASAVVADAAQAALALPMLCFPQVLFAGAIVPVGEMALPGRMLSMGMANRHSFEALGQSLDLDGYAAVLPSMAAYGDTFAGSPLQSWVLLSLFTAICLAATVLALHRRSRPAASRRR